MKTITKLWIGIVVLVLLVPIGLLAEGTAWGEWGISELEGIDYVPKGMARLSDIWHSPLSGYNLPGWRGSFAISSSGYILSAIIGIGATYLLISVIGKYLATED